MSNIKDVDIDDIKNEFKNISVKCGILMKSNGRTENYLNEVYGRIGISFEVTVEDFESEEAKSFLADGLDVCGASGFMTASTGEMRQLKQLYMDSKGGSVDEKRLYLFLVNKAQCTGEDSKIDPSAVCGDMPRNSKVGYLFAENAGDQAAFNRTVAHELGHGAFTWQHPFDEPFKNEQGATRNLMDYVTDDDLAYFQWQSTLGLNLTWGFLEGDEDAMNLYDALKVKYMWAISSFADKTTETFAKTLKEHGYTLIHSGSYNKEFLQNEGDNLSSSGHYYSVLELKKLNPNIDDDCLCRMGILENKMTEEQVRDMYENGITLGVINLEEGDFLCAFYGNIGTRLALSNGVLEKVLSYFYNKNLPPNTTLLFDYNSELSVALNEYYYFQHDFLYEKVVKKIYENIDNLSVLDDNKLFGTNNLDKILNFTPQGSNFVNDKISKAYDITFYDYYGLMGGIQGLKVDYQVYNKNNYYLLETDITISDWYGSDFGDICDPGIKHWMACMNAFFWLQQHYGCSPFKTQIKYKCYVILKK